MEKKYIKPELEVVDLSMNTILAGSIESAAGGRMTDGFVPEDEGDGVDTDDIL